VNASGAAGADQTLVAVDIDGTLLTWNGELPGSAAAAVARVLEHPGAQLVLATGRSAHSTLAVARRIGFRRGWAVCSNGSVTVRLDPALPEGWEVIECVTFDPGHAIRAVRAALPDARFAAEELGAGFLVTEAFPAGELDGRVTVVTDEELASRPVTRLVVRQLDLEPAALDGIVRETRLQDVTYAMGWSGWVDLNPPGVSKASALEAVRRRLGVRPERTVAVGDGGNDVTMLRWAARGVAMGGSDLAVIAAADEVTGLIEEDGLAQVLESLV
jgi:HAD superfamily hydrolase (TIGR01484 family)